MTTSRGGMKTTALAAMPFCTPSAITTIVATHTMIIEIRTAGTMSKEMRTSWPPSAG